MDERKRTTDEDRIKKGIDGGETKKLVDGPAMMKRSLYCRHGYVWGRCPEGCK